MRRVLATNPRSGTHYLKALISSALGGPPVENHWTAPEELLAAVSSLPDNRLLYGHLSFSKHADVLDPERFPDLRMIVLTRHPIDRLISQLAWERVLTGDRNLPDPARTPQQLARELLLGLWDGKPWPNGLVVENYANWHNFLLRDLVTDWLERRNCLLVKFEELTSKPCEILTMCLNFLAVSISPEEVKKTTQAITFERLSGGRKPGQMDLASHYRRGVPGEWTSLFSLGEIDVLRSKYSIEFEKTGYVL